MDNAEILRGITEANCPQELGDKLRSFAGEDDLYARHTPITEP
jgi:hypothetical protein